MNTEEPEEPGRLRRLSRTLFRLGSLALGGAGIAVAFGERFHELDETSRSKMNRELLVELTRLLEAIRGAEKAPLCADCSDFGYGYMFKEDVWKEASAAPAERTQEKTRFLCLPCCEKRLKRPIVRDDLDPELPINGPLLYAWKEAEDDIPSLKTG